MDDAERFFEGAGGRQPLLAQATGTVRFELVDDDQVDMWTMTIERGAVTVAQEGLDASCRVRCARDLFVRLCRGDANAFTSVLRGELLCAGDVELLFAVQRLFPGPQPVVTT
jgi:hypothetical protein